MDFLTDTQNIEEILEASSQGELVDLINKHGLEALFIDEELVERLEEAEETLLSNLKKLKRQRQLFKMFRTIEEELNKVVGEKLDMKRLQNTPLFDVDVLLELDNERLKLIDDREKIKRKLKFDDEDAMEESIIQHLEKFNKVRRKLKEENKEISERSKKELIDELFDFYNDDDEEAEQLLDLPAALNIEELQGLLKEFGVI